MSNYGSRNEVFVDVGLSVPPLAGHKTPVHKHPQVILHTVILLLCLICKVLKRKCSVPKGFI